MLADSAIVSSLLSNSTILAQQNIQSVNGDVGEGGLKFDGHGAF
jgi:hypothetical protein